MYPDNVVFYTSHKYPATARAKLQEDANTVFNWFTSSGLSIHTDKTKIVVFSHDRPTVPVNLEIKMGIHTLSTRSQYEYLGVILDKTLTLERSVRKSVSNTIFRSVTLQSLRKYAGQWQCPPKMPPVQQIHKYSRTECLVTCWAFLN